MMKLYQFLPWVLSIGIFLQPCFVHSCGYSYLNARRTLFGCPVDSNIVDGQVSNIYNFPWMAAIYVRKKNGKKKLICGGTIISKWSILTAAHCIHQRKIKRYSIMVGSAIRNRGKFYKVSHAIRHHHYRTFKNDIGIIFLRKKISYSKRVQPICLPEQSSYDDLHGFTAYVIGWGRMHYRGQSSKIMRQACLPFVKRSKCNRSYRKYKNIRISTSQICAGYDRGTPDSCLGDSGGPLLFSDRDDIWRQIGIVSFGEACAKPFMYGVYTNVAYFKDWIIINMI